MAKRLTDTDIWDKEWFMKLSPKLKCLVKFVRDKCDLAGVWNPNWTLTNLYIGDKCNEQELLSIDNGNQFHKLESGKIFCIDFITFQNGILNEKSPIHIKIHSLLKQHSIPYPYPITRVCNTPVVIVGVEGNSNGIVKSNSSDDVFSAELYPTFEDFWNEYDKKVGDKEKIKKKFEALSQKEKESIMWYLPEYKKATIEKQYRKNPETFLNNKSWNDEIIIKENNGNKQTIADTKRDELRALKAESIDFLQNLTTDNL